MKTDGLSDTRKLLSAICSNYRRQRRRLISTGKFCLPAIALFAVLFAGPQTNAAEIVPFRNTGVDGHIDLDFFSRKYGDLDQSSNSQKLTILTQNYVYHPNLLDLNLNAGFLFFQDSYDTNTGTNKVRDDTYDYSVRGNLLRKKKYPMRFYFERNNPVTSLSSGELFRQQDTRYGFDLALLEPLLPLKLNFFTSHDETSGSGLNRVQDDSTDKYGFTASRMTPGSSDGYSIRFENTSLDSSSGSLNLPITRSRNIIESLTYNSHWLLGDQVQYRYSDRASITQREGVTEEDEFSFSPNLVWKHSEAAQSSYSYSHLQSKQDSLENTHRSLSAELDYWYDDRTRLGVDTEIVDSAINGVDSESITTGARVSHRLPVDNGHVNLSAGLSYGDNEQRATVSQADIIGELITLSGLAPVALTRDFIIVSSIVVQNSARTQTYVENIDYRIIVIGIRTEIQLLVGGNINDPELVLVDYSYQTGGSSGYTNLTQNYSATLTLGDFYDLYLNYEKTDPKLTSGSPTLLQNERTRQSLGGSVEYPVSRRIKVGANIDLTDFEQDISSYDSESYSVFSQFIISYSASLRFNLLRQITDNTFSVEDRDLSRYSLLFRSTPRDHLTVSADYYSEEDTGGTVIWQTKHFSLNAQWQFRRLTMNANAKITDNRTGNSESEQRQFMLTIRRDF